MSPLGRLASPAYSTIAYPTVTQRTHQHVHFPQASHDEQMQTHLIRSPATGWGVDNAGAARKYQSRTTLEAQAVVVGPVWTAFELNPRLAWRATHVDEAQLRSFKSAENIRQLMDLPSVQVKAAPFR